MSEPKTTRWAIASQIVGTAAVVVSLIYLAAEVRQNTRAIRGSAFQELVHSSNASLLAVAADSGLAAIRARGLADPSSLNGTDRERYTALVRVYWRNWENAFLQRERGLLGDEEWAAYRSLICDGRHRYAATWNDHVAFLTPAFLRFVDHCDGDNEKSR